MYAFYAEYEGPSLILVFGLSLSADAIKLAKAHWMLTVTPAED